MAGANDRVVRVVTKACHQQYRQVAPVASSGCENLIPVAVGHFDIRDYQIKGLLFDLGYRLVSIFTDCADTAIFTEYIIDGLADIRLIIGD